MPPPPLTLLSPRLPMRPWRLLASSACALTWIVTLVTAPTGCSDAPAAARPDQQGEPYRSLYDDSTLAYWKARYEPNLRFNLDSLILPLLSTRETQAVDDLTLELPLSEPRDPLAFYVLRPPPTIFLSILSIKFLDDLAIASAWLAVNDYSVEPSMSRAGSAPALVPVWRTRATIRAPVPPPSSGAAV